MTDRSARKWQGGCGKGRCLGLIGGFLLAARMLAQPVAMPGIFSDGMVLEAGRPAPVWGRARPGMEVSVMFGSARVVTRADREGNWRITLPSLSPSDESRELSIAVSGTSTVLHDVLVGEVWLGSGQSNMAMTVQRSGEEALAARSPFPKNLRFYDGARWTQAVPSRVGELSAVAWAFARERSQAKRIPIGMIVIARGGTRIEAWMPREAVDRTNRGRGLAALADTPEVIAAAQDDEKSFRAYSQTRLYRWRMGRALPTSLYRKLVLPLGDFAVAGALWYQGESNAETAEDAEDYRDQLVQLIGSWREQWRRPKLPFLIVGLPSYSPPPGEGSVKTWNALRESQKAAASLTGSVLVDAFDLGDSSNIHPTRKYELGKRLAASAASVLDVNS